MWGSIPVKGLRGNKTEVMGKESGETTEVRGEGRRVASNSFMVVIPKRVGFVVSLLFLFNVVSILKKLN